jgi:hypothetical protein
MQRRKWFFQLTGLALMLFVCPYPFFHGRLQLLKHNEIGHDTIEWEMIYEKWLLLVSGYVQYYLEKGDLHWRIRVNELPVPESANEGQRLQQGCCNHLWAQLNGNEAARRERWQ